MSRHRKSHKRSYRSYRKSRKTSRKRRYRARGGNLVNYNPAGYSPVGTVAQSVINQQSQYYIPYNQNTGLLPNPESTSNRP